MKALALLLALTACTRADEDRARIHPKNPPPTPTPTPTPTPGPTPVITLAPVCPALSISVGAAGTWIGDADSQRFAAACQGAPDVAAVGAELCARHAAAPACKAVEVAAERVPYQSIISIMDTAVAAGLPDVGLLEPASLSTTFPAAAAAAQRLPARCGQPAVRCSPPQPPPTVPGPVDLKQAPVVVITAAGDITIDGARVTVADLGAKLKALPHPTGALILQADQSADAKLIAAIVKTAQLAGYDNVAFAVKRP